MLTWRNPNNLWCRYVHNINSVNDKISNSNEEKTSITMSIARLDGGITESHAEPRRQHLHLHLQLRSGRLRNDKQVGAHGNLLHHLRNGGDFGFLERIPENRRSGHPTHKTHFFQYSLFTTVEHIARAWLKDCTEFVIWFHTWLIHVGQCLTCCAPRALPFPHSVFLLPRTTIVTTRSTRTKNTQCIISLFKNIQSKSNAIKNHSGVKTYTRKTFSTDYEPKELATVSRISRISRRTDPHQSYDAQKEHGERDHQAAITEEVKEFWEFGNPVSTDSKFSETSYLQSKMHFDVSVESIADSDLEDGELRCWFHHCIPKKLRGNPMHRSCRREM